MENRVVVFEDVEANFERLKAELLPRVQSLGCEVQKFELDHLPRLVPGRGKDQGDLVAEHLLQAPETLLAVLDEDLSQYRGLSRSAVHGACAEYSIPVAVYHYITGQDEAARLLKRWRESEITIDNSSSWSAIAAQCAAISKGIKSIRQALEADRGKNLSEIIPKIMRAPPDAEIQLGQYTWGRSRSLDLAREDSSSDSLRAWATTVAYWIRNQVLQFPGALLNPIAASAHLDVDSKSFLERPELRQPFTDALYDGPFGELGPFWWTTKLDDILAAGTPEGVAEVVTGHDLLGRLGRPVARSRCIEGHEGTGYYCVVNRAPVCIDHSVEARGWFPAGATKSRIHRKTYDQMSPWKVF